MTRRQTVFAGLDQPPAWPPTRGRMRPHRLDTPIDSLPGVGPALKRKLGRLGLVTVRDLLEHRPFRYESAAEEVAIADLRGDEEVVIAGEVLNVSTRPLRGRRSQVTARISDGTAAVSAAWFNQPWVAERLEPGVRVRLRGKPGRYGFDVKSYDLGDAHATADFAPVYPASEEIAPKRLRTLVAAALPCVDDYGDPLPAELSAAERLPLKRDALVALHRPVSEEEAEQGRRRLAFEELLLLQIGIARRVAARERTLAPSLGKPGELILRYRKALPFALTPYQEQAIREIDADLARTAPDAAAPPGRRRLGQDRRRAVRAAARGRERAAGRADGADRDARRAALPHPRRALRPHRRHVRAAHERFAEARPGRAARRGRRRRHARSHPGRRRAARPRGRRRRRAAPIRSRAAQGHCGRKRTARPAHDGDADPAHARADRLRRPRALDHREAAGVAQARGDDAHHRGAGVGGVHAARPAAPRGPAGIRRLSAHRGVGDERSRAPPRRRRSASAAPSSATSGSAACTGGCGPTTAAG